MNVKRLRKLADHIESLTDEQFSLEDEHCDIAYHAVSLFDGPIPEHLEAYLNCKGRAAEILGGDSDDQLFNAFDWPRYYFLRWEGRDTDRPLAVEYLRELATRYEKQQEAA